MEQPRLGRGCVALLAVLVAGTSVLLGFGVPRILAKRRIDAERRVATLKLLEIRAAAVRKYNEGSVPLVLSSCDLADFLGKDAWGNGIVYACPGPIHRNGFDLISCGPDGDYEEGRGDDLVVGDEVPG